MNDNLRRIERVAQGLGSLCDEMIFVGGSVIIVYVNDSAASEIRPTLDIDLVTGIKSYRKFELLESELRKRGFVNDLTSGVICRWIYKGETVDIMPCDEKILGFSNKWYLEGFRNKISYPITPELNIQILPVCYYLACKIEALNSRGGNDWRTSHDFEDIIYILNYDENFLSQFQQEGNQELKKYLKTWAHSVLNRPNCREEIETMLPYGEAERTGYILDIIKEIGKSYSE